MPDQATPGDSTQPHNFWAAPLTTGQHLYNIGTRLGLYHSRQSGHPATAGRLAGPSDPWRLNITTLLGCPPNYWATSLHPGDQTRPSSVIGSLGTHHKQGVLPHQATPEISTPLERQLGASWFGPPINWGNYRQDVFASEQYQRDVRRPEGFGYLFSTRRQG